MLRLTPYVAELKRAVFDRLSAGSAPETGRYDAAVFAAARDLGTPQMGAAVFSPRTIRLEFIYQNRQSANLVFSVEVDSPERIVFMPVPEWVTQTIWQGEIDGSYRFEGEAAELLRVFEAGCAVGVNETWFEKRMPTTRE